MGTTWQEVSERQCGVLSEADLRVSGVSRAFVRNQLRAGRWARRTHSVFTTTTGPLSREQRLWVAVEHAGPHALIGGLTATELLGMKSWTRDEVTVLVDQELSFDPVEGVRFFRTRRPLEAMRHPTHRLPTCRLEPAVLLFAAHERSTRTALGAVAATVQQRLTTPATLSEWTRLLRPLRRAPAIRELLADVSGGSQSLAEIDVLRLCRSWGLAPPRRQKAPAGPRRAAEVHRLRVGPARRPCPGPGDRRWLPHQRGELHRRRAASPWTDDGSTHRRSVHDLRDPSRTRGSHA